MIKKTFILLLSVAAMLACGQKENDKLAIRGTLEDYTAGSLYLYEAANQQYGMIVLRDSFAVTNGQFTYANDSLPTQLYFISTHNHPQMEETFAEGAYLFLKQGDNQLKISKNSRGEMQADVSGFPLQEQFAAFAQELDNVSNRVVIDSLDQLFYAARDAGNSDEMARIREVSEPYYIESDEKTGEWLKNKLEENKQSLFGLYLYYTYAFQNYNFSTPEEVAKAEARLAEADAEARRSVYFERIEEKLARIKNSSVGSKAPEITGLDSLDNEVKLSDFQGQYVLVDFWSSGCSWCRKETPHLQKAYEAFKDKNFTILGVSSDFRKSDWLEAIHEDQSYWNHIMMRRNEIDAIMNSYVIVGIPEILLIDPQGVILAKGLRGENIYNTVAEFVK